MSVKLSPGQSIPTMSSPVRDTIVLFAGYKVQNALRPTPEELPKVDPNISTVLLRSDVESLASPPRQITVLGLYGVLNSSPYHICTSRDFYKEAASSFATLSLAWHFIEKNFDPRGKLIVYGNSAGGVCAMDLCRAVYQCKRTFDFGSGFPTSDKPNPPNSPKTVVDLLVTCDAAAGLASDYLNRSVPPCVRKNLNFYQLVKRQDQENSHGEPNFADEPSFTQVENQDWTNRKWFKPDGVEDIATHYRLGFATNPAALQAIRETLFPALAPGRDPLVAPPVVHGFWRSVGDGHELIALRPNRVLDWVPATGDFRVWRYDKSVTAHDPLPSPPVQEGNWRTIRAGHQIIYLDGNQVLDWHPESGQYRVFHFTSRYSDPLHGPAKVKSKWATISDGHILVYCGGDLVLDWIPATGEYRVWQFDRSNTSADAFPGDPFQKGKWSSIRTGHELVYLGSDRILDWEPKSGWYRVWRITRKLRASDFLPGPPLMEGVWRVPVGKPLTGQWKAIGGGRKLVTLSDDRLLDWEPTSGAYRIWEVAA